MKPEQKKEALRWLEQAERDFDDAKYTDKGRRYNLACFLAQQSAEKALKAYIYSRGIEQVWGHSVCEVKYCDELIDGYDKSGRQLYKLGNAWTNFKIRQT